DAEPAEDEEGRQRDERVGQQVVEVEDDGGIGGEQREELQDQEIQAIVEREVVHVQPERRPEEGVVQIPTVVDEGLDPHLDQQRVVGVAQWALQVRLPEFQHPDEKTDTQTHRRTITRDGLEATFHTRLPASSCATPGGLLCGREVRAESIYTGGISLGSSPP